MEVYQTLISDKPKMRLRPLFSIKKILLFLGLILLITLFIAVFTKLTLNRQKVYSVVLFSSDRTQTISLPAKLTGKGIPNSKVTILVTPGNQKKDIQTNSKGDWEYTLSNNSPGDYHFTVEVWDTKQKVVAIKNYRIKVIRDNIFSKFKLSNQLTPKLAYAQECEEEQEPNYKKWSSQMKKLGIYPVCESGEIILYSEEEYDKHYCPDPCAILTRQRSLSDQIRSHLSTKGNTFIKDLVAKLYQKGYAPLPILISYMPELSDPRLQREFGLSQAQAYALNAKTSINEDTLKVLLSEVYQEHFNYLYKGEALGELIDLAGLRTVVNVFTDPRHHNLLYLDADESRDFLLGLLTIYQPARGVAQLGEGTVKISISALKNIRSLRTALKSGEKIPLKVLGTEDFQAAYFARKAAIEAGTLKGDMPQYMGKISQWTEDLGSLSLSPDVVASGRALQLNPAFGSTFSGATFHNFLKLGLDNGFVSAVDKPGVITPAVDRVRSSLTTFFETIGIRRPIVNLDSVSIYGKVYVVDDEYAKLWWNVVTQGKSIFAPHGFAGVTMDDLIIITRSSYESPDGIGTLFHELIHTVGGGINIRQFYGSEEPGKKALALIYEIGTDAWVNRLLGQQISPKVGSLSQGAYIVNDRATSKALFDRIIPALQKQGDHGINALLDFALTGDSDQFLLKVTGKTGAEGEAILLGVIRKAGINVNRLDYLKRGSLLTAAGAELGGIVYLSLEYEVSDKLRNFINNLPVFKQNKFEQAVDTMFANSIVTPAFEASSDILTNDYDPDFGFEPISEIIITKAEGNFYPGGELQTSSIVSEFGEVDYNPDEYIKTWTIEPTSSHSGMGVISVKNTYAQENDLNTISYGEIEPLKGGEDCFDNCQLTLPANIQPGEYKLVVYLADKESKKIIDSDSYPIEIKKALRQIESFTINDQSYTKEEAKKGFKLPLNADPAQPQLFNLPVTIRFTNGPSRYLVLNINYQPKITATPLPETTTEPESTSQPAPTEEPVTSECHEEARDLGEGVARNYNVCSDGSGQPIGEEYCINGSDDPGCRLNQ